MLNQEINSEKNVQIAKAQKQSLKLQSITNMLFAKNVKESNL